MAICNSRHTGAVFIFIEQEPSFRRNGLYLHRRGYPLEAVYFFLKMDEELPCSSCYAEAFYEANQYAERLECSAEDFGEKYRYKYDVAADRLVITRRKSSADNLCVPHFPAVFGPWQEEFAGSLAEFIATYTNPLIASHARLEQFGLPTEIPSFAKQAA